MSEFFARFRQHPQFNAWLKWWWAWAGGVSVRTKFLGIILTLTILLGLSVTWQVRAVMNRTLIEELQERGRSIISDLAARSVDPILLNDTFALYELLAETVSNHPDVVYVFVLDPQGQVLAHTFEGGFPTALLSLNPTDSDDNSHHLRYVSEQKYIHDFASPIFEGQAGTVHLGLTETRLQSVVTAVTGQILLTTLIMTLGGVVAAMLLTWLFTHPILELVSTTRRVGRGDLTARAPHWADDEIGDLADAFNQMVSDLETSQQAVAEKEAARSRLLAQLINAQEEERRRIAHELHDGVGQSLTSLMVGLKLISRLNGQTVVANKSEELRQVAGETLDEIRLLSRQLRPSVLDDLGLAAALERYADEFSDHYANLVVDLHCNLPDRLPAPVETTLYRIAQEAMTNAARHSRGRTLSVLLSSRKGRVQAIIEDDGCGFDPIAARKAKDSVGLHSMTERADLVGGKVEIESSSEGTTVFVEVPL